MKIFLCLLCTLSAFAMDLAPEETTPMQISRGTGDVSKLAERKLSPEEANLMRIIWGTDDVFQLAEIEKKPQKYWRERAEYLLSPGVTMTHKEFCLQYIQDAKAHIAQSPKSKKDQLPWFVHKGSIDSVVRRVYSPNSAAFLAARCFLCEQARLAIEDPSKEAPCLKSEVLARRAIFRKELTFLQEGATLSSEHCDAILAEFEQAEEEFWFTRPNALEDILTKFLPKSTHAYINALCCLYSEMCDHLYNGTSISRKDVMSRIRGMRVNLRQGLPEAFVERLRWQIIPGGLFPLFDGLVMRSNRYFLCSAPSDFSDRDRFCAHGQFFGWFGLRYHDINAHALSTYNLEKNLAEAGVSEDTHFGRFCNPESMPVGNLMAQSNWVQTHFYHYHDLPASRETKRKILLAMLFPTPNRLLDEGFRDITPYLMDVPPDFDWKTTPLKKAEASDESIHEYLLGMGRLNCSLNVDFIPSTSIVDYIQSFCQNMRFLSERDLENAQYHFEQVLNIICSKLAKNWNKDTKVALRTEACAFAQHIFSEVEAFVQKEAGWGVFIFVDVHPLQYFILHTFYAYRCKRLSDENNVMFTLYRNDVGFSMKVRTFYDCFDIIEFTKPDALAVFDSTVKQPFVQFQPVSSDPGKDSSFSNLFAQFLEEAVDLA